MLPKLGIIAGGGALPGELIRHCLESGRNFFVIALKGQADDSLVTGISHEWVRLGAAGTIIKSLRRENVQDLVLAGSVTRPSLLALRPDFWALKFFLRTGAAALGDDGLLKALISALQEREGFTIVGSDDLLPGLIIPEGPLGKLMPDKRSMHDIAVGLKEARKLGKRDIGQAVIVRDGILVASEDAKGTDALLRSVKPSGHGISSGVLVKTAKPQQERRADLPTIGPETLNGVSLAGLAGIALEAGNALVLNRTDVCDLANQKGLFVFGAKLDDETG